MADLRQVVFRILRDYGHNVYLQRRGADVDVDQYRKAQYSNKLERHTVRHMHPSSVGLAGATQQAREGVETNVDRVYWFRWDVNPTEGDRIIDHKPEGNPPTLKQEAFLIDYAQPMRGNGGRIEYWSCGATREED